MGDGRIVIELHPLLKPERGGAAGWVAAGAPELLLSSDISNIKAMLRSSYLASPIDTI